MIKNFLSITLLFFVFLSCTENTDQTEEPIEIKPLTESKPEKVSEIIEQEIAEEKLPEAVKSIIRADEMKETKAALEKKHGTQWDFCTCVIKSDSILTAFNSVKDEDFDVLMKRSDYIDSKCSIIRATPNTTPDERAKHEKAINACRKAFKEEQK